MADTMKIEFAMFSCVCQKENANPFLKKNADAFLEKCMEDLKKI